MNIRKDKKKVLGEIFDDARIKGFLEFVAPEGVSRDFYLLEKAYRGMHEENFSTFLKFFQDAGFQINATGPTGKTFLESIEQHRHARSYRELIEKLNA